MLTRLDKIDALCDEALQMDSAYVDYDYSDNTAALCRLLSEAAAESEEAHAQALAVTLCWGRYDVLGQSPAPTITVHKVVAATSDSPTYPCCGAAQETPEPCWQCGA